MIDLIKINKTGRWSKPDWGWWKKSEKSAKRDTAIDMFIFILFNTPQQLKLLQRQTKLLVFISEQKKRNEYIKENI